MSAKNYIQYIDDTYALKVKPIEFIEGYNEQVEPYNYVEPYYLISGIDTEFFIVAVFVDNKRFNGFEFLEIDNLFMTAFINDLEMTDLNVVPRNHFFEANKQVKFSLPLVDHGMPSVNAYISGYIPRHDVDVKSVVRHEVDVVSMPAVPVQPKAELIIYDRPKLVLKSFIGGSQSSRFNPVSILAKVVIRIYLDGTYDLLDNTVISNLVPDNYTRLTTASRIASGKSFPFFNFFIKPVDLSGGDYVFSDFTQLEMFFNLKTKEFAVVHCKFRLNDYGNEVELFYNNIIQNYKHINQGITIKSPDSLVELSVSNEYL